MDISYSKANNLENILALRLRKQMIREIYYHTPLAGTTAQELNDYYCYHLAPFAYQILILRVIPKENRALPPTREQLNRAEAKLRADLIPVFHELETAIIEDRIVCFFNITTHRDSIGTEQFKLAIARFFSEISTEDEFSDCEFIMAEGETAESIDGLDQCLKAALHAMEYGVIYGLNQRYDSYEQVQQLDNIMSILTVNKRNQMRHYTETLNTYALRALIDETFKESKEEATKNPGLAYRLPQAILDLTAAAISECISTESDFFEAKTNLSQKINNCLSLENLHKLTIESVLTLIDYYRTHLPSGNSPAILGAKSFILQHFSEKLSLARIAEYVGLNPQYLSVRFKSEMGLSITDYIVNLRIEQAKDALRNTTKAINQIAEDIGYSDPHYFSRIFARYVGMSPRKYRHSAR